MLRVEEGVDVLGGDCEELLALMDTHAAEEDVHGLFVEPVAYRSAMTVCCKSKNWLPCIGHMRVAY